jgi:hypothetical protein
MSAKATFWAWEQAVTGNTKLVLLCLGDYANDVNKAWCSAGTIATKCGISRRTVFNCLSELCELGLITNTGYTNKGNGLDTVIYCLNCTSAEFAPVQNLHITSAEFAHNPTIEPTNILTTNVVNISDKIKNFKKPSLDEVKEYLNSIASPVNAQQFMDYYDSKGWLIGKTKMKNWQAACRTWTNNAKGVENGNNKQRISGNASNAQQWAAVGARVAARLQQ